MKLCFVSNYINHHQIPFCNAMAEALGENFTFIQTIPMEAERVQMGWQENDRPTYVKCYYEEESACRELIAECDIVLFGGCDDESYIEERLRAGRIVVRVNERLYKEGQWKAISPRGLVKKYKDHTRYRSKRVYFLCAGAYVASDMHIIRAYPGKMFRWGYFPPTKKYDIQALLEGKGAGDEHIPELLFAGRFIDWKHPELPLQCAKYLKEKGLAFHLTMIGDGELMPEMKRLREAYGLTENVDMPGFRGPDTVRSCMEKADIYFLTSDRGEGWGAVANEAMNSGCALLADHLTGAAPFLIEHGKNGLVYPDDRPEELFALAERLVKDRDACRKMGLAAYETITGIWNAEEAAKRLLTLCEKLLTADPLDRDDKLTTYTSGPCSPAPVIGEKQMYRRMTKGEAWKTNR